MNQDTNTETSDSDWKGLYRVGAVAALLMFVLTLARLRLRLTRKRERVQVVGTR